MAEDGGNATQTKRISRAEAIEGARALTGQPGRVVAGALAGDDRDSFTENQLKKAVDDFTKRPEHSEEDEGE